MAETTKTKKTSPALAKKEDGTVQITFTFPFSLIKKEKEEALKELAKEANVPGFRKGNAPLSQAEKQISESSTVEKALGKILPKEFANAIEKFKLKPIIYPKFEVISAEENKDWQIRAVTCEMPKIDLGNYKTIIKGESKAKTIWTPEKGKPDGKDTPKEKTKEEKEQELISILLKNFKVEIPKILIDEEVNNRLANLLQRIEKLGLGLDAYLSSIGKTPESIRKEYEIQASNSITLDLVLQKVAQEENIKVEDKEVEQVIKASTADPKLAKNLNTPQQRRMIELVLIKRKTLESLSLLM